MANRPVLERTRRQQPHRAPSVGELIYRVIGGSVFNIDIIMEVKSWDPRRYRNITEQQIYDNINQQVDQGNVIPFFF